MIGKRVKVTVGNDNWGEVINPYVPHVVTTENDAEYGISPIFSEIPDSDLIKKGYYKFSVNKSDVHLWEAKS
jgi:hypothetical protein